MPRLEIGMLRANECHAPWAESWVPPFLNPPSGRRLTLDRDFEPCSSHARAPRAQPLRATKVYDHDFRAVRLGGGRSEQQGVSGEAPRYLALTTRAAGEPDPWTSGHWSPGS